MRRRLKWVAAATLVLVVGGLVAIWSLDAIAKRLIERYGTAATQVAVNVGAVSLSPLRGGVTIRDLTVANPSGFSSDNAFRLGEIHVRVDAGTLGRNPLVIDEIAIVDPQVEFELNREGASNIEVLRRQIKESHASTKGKAPSSPRPSQPTVVAPAPKQTAVAPAPKPTKQAQRFLIKRLSIQGAQLAIAAGVLGSDRRVVALPNAEETNLGARSGGAAGNELAAIVVGVLARDVATTVAATGIEQALEKGIGGETGKTLGEGVGDAVKDVGRALNKLFGDRKE